MSEIKGKEEQKKIFFNYTDQYIKNALEDTINGHKDKQAHSVFVMDEALLVDALFTKYTGSYKNLLTLESLFHDIGRFEQLKKTGSFKDTELSQYYPGMVDHGDLGSEVIKEHGLLNDLIPGTRIYDEEVQKVIKLHSKVNQDLLNGIILDYLDVFKKYDLSEIFLDPSATKERKVLTNVNTAIIQDVDRLDIFRKIVKGIWVPMASEDSIDPEIFELFKKGKLPTIAEIKAQGKWNANVGHLIRLSFIDQMNLVPVLLSIQKENLIDKVYEASGNSKVVEAYEIAKVKLEEAINHSEDGIIVEKSEKAKRQVK